MNPKLPMVFRSVSDCGCSNSGFPVSPSPCSSSSSTAICDDRLAALTGAPRLKLVGVVSGTTCLSSLKAGVSGTVRGFLFDDGSQTGQYVEPEPKLTLPVRNPKDGSDLLATGSWQYILVATGAEPHPWGFVGAPTTGEHLVYAENGVFKFKAAGAVPGLSAVCSSPASTAKGNIIVCTQIGEDGNGDPIFGTRKLAVTDGRVLVGDVDEDGNAGHKTLGADEFLAHPKGKLNDFKFNTISALEDGGGDEEDGLPLLATYGAGAVTDAVPVYYSPAEKKLYRRPEPVAYYKSLVTNATGSAPSSFGPLPGGHCVAASKTFHYPKAMITAQIAFSSGSEAVNFALFRDGVQIENFQFARLRDATLVFIDENIPLGEHVYDVRWKKNVESESPSATITYSNISIATVGR